MRPNPLTALFFSILLGIATVTMNVSAQPRITKADFGKTKDGKAVDVYTLTNGRGSEAKIITYGGAVISLKIADRQGKVDDIDSLQKQLAADVRRLQEECEAKKEKLRASFAKL